MAHEGIDRGALRWVLREIHLADLHLGNGIVPVPGRQQLSASDRCRSCNVLGEVQNVVGVILGLLRGHDLCVNRPPRVGAICNGLEEVLRSKIGVGTLVVYVSTPQ